MAGLQISLTMERALPYRCPINIGKSGKRDRSDLNLITPTPFTVNAIQNVYLSEEVTVA